MKKSYLWMLPLLLLFVAGIIAGDSLVGEKVSAGEAKYDVIVVGGGNAGIPTAIGAARTGARVAVLEKLPFLGGTLVVSGGQLSAADSRLQIAAGFEDSPENHYRDIMNMGDYRATPRLLKKHTENAGWTIDWLEELGVKFDKGRPVLMDHHELYSVARSYQPIGGGAALTKTLVAELDKFVDQGSVDIHFSTKATELIQDANGQVVGVKAAKDGQAAEFYANEIVLATGGYGANRQMLEKYHADAGENALVYVPDHAQGDGIVMATEIGADLTNMDLLLVYPGGIEHPEKPGHPFGPRVNLSPAFAGDIWVNQEGRRFVNEDTLSPDEKEMAIVRQPNITQYVVFDQAIKEANNSPVYGWDWDQLEAAASEGKVAFKADTLEELAAKAGIDVNGLEKTVARYNEYVEAGWDKDFDRPNLSFKLENGPFYAIKSKPLIYLTHGGLKVTDRLEVLQQSGQVIPGLYAVGEVIGMAQLMGNAFAGGIGNTSPITLGIMLGEELGRQ